MRKGTVIFIWILIITSIVIAIGGTYYGFKDMGEAERRPSAIPKQVILISVIVAIYTSILAVTQDSAYPVNNTLHACRKYNGEDKVEKIRSYVTNRFAKTAKFKRLLLLNPARTKSVVRDREGNKYKVTVTLRDGKSYQFTIVQRDNHVDDKASTAWLIDDVRGSGF